MLAISQCFSGERVCLCSACVMCCVSVCVLCAVCVMYIYKL